MRALVVYESIYGNTHCVADHIADGLRSVADVVVLPVADATPDPLTDIDLVVAGGPTHVHGITTTKSRHTAIEAAAKPESTLTTDSDAERPGLRAWFDALEVVAGTQAAAFDTRLDGPALFTGRASRGIARRLADHGFTLIAAPESFLVDRDSHLAAGEADRAVTWGVRLGRAVRGGEVRA